MYEDVGVLLIFFNKVNTLKEVFETIRLAQPKKLFLAQDGARTGVKADIVKIRKCRAVVEKIDWDCEVYINYSSKNLCEVSKKKLACGPRIYSAITWAFQYVDKLIILEDDSVPNKSFYKFMDEMLELYKYDDRIQMISGIERFGENKFCRSSYYFSTINAGCAWGTWRRVWNDVEKWADCSFIENSENIEKIGHYVKYCMPRIYHNFIKRGKVIRERNKQINCIYSWEYALATSMIMSSRVSITPKFNLIKNIGIVAEATHSGNSLQTLPRRVRCLFFMKTHELEFPLKHPQYIMRDSQYEQEYDKKFCYTKWDSLCMKIEHIILLIIHGTIGEIENMIKRKLKHK